MLVIKIELHPHGRSNDARELGRMVIANVGGTSEIGEYEISARNARPAVWGAPSDRDTADVLNSPHHTGTITGHARLTEPVWSLLAKALAAIGFKS